MFEKYFVTCPLSIALRAAGFDEPCMATRETYLDGSQKFNISYSSEPLNPATYNSIIKEAMELRPGLFVPKLKNSEFPPWLYAAPLYDQVFEWLFSKGIYLHPYYAPKFEGKKAIAARWGVNIYNLDLKFLNAGGLLGAMAGEPVNADRRDAIEQAIFAAIKLLTNEPKMDV